MNKRLKEALNSAKNGKPSSGFLTSRRDFKQNVSMIIILTLTTLLLASFIINVILYSTLIEIRDSILIQMFIEHEKSTFLEGGFR